MDENELNIIRKRLKDLETKYELLNNANITNKEKIKRNEDTIKNLITNIKVLKVKQEKEINQLKEKYDKLENILKNRENGIEKNEIIINNKNNKTNDLLNIKNIYDNVETLVKIRLREFELDYNLSNKKQNKQKYEKKDEIIDYNGRPLIDVYESKLIKIFCDDNPQIDINEKNELKKICLALIIDGKDISSIFGEFSEKNLNNKINDLDKGQDLIIGNKKAEMHLFLDGLQDIPLINKIEKEKIDEFAGILREKFGISEENISDKDLKRELKKNSNDKKKAIKAILKKIKFIK